MRLDAGMRSAPTPVDVSRTRDRQSFERMELDDQRAAGWAGQMFACLSEIATRIESPFNSGRDFPRTPADGA